MYLVSPCVYNGCTPIGKESISIHTLGGKVSMICDELETIAGITDYM